YNEIAAPGEDLRFYGFDMRRYAYSFQFLTEGCKKAGIDTESLESLMDGENWVAGYSNEDRIRILSQIKAQLEKQENTEQTVHCADMLLQYLDLQGKLDAERDDPVVLDALATLRDKLLAENINWIAAQESRAGHDR